MKRTHLIALALVALGFPTPARAQATTTAPASAEADALFDQGRQLMDAGKIADACNAFDASQRLSPAVSTLFNQAHCREQNQQFATAYGLFREAERQTRAPLDDATQKLNRVAIDRAKQLEPRLSKLTIVVAATNHVDGLEVRRAGELVDPGTWNRPLPIDGGHYKIVAQAPGYLPWTTTIEVSPERDAKTIEVPSLVKAPVKPAPPSARSRLIPVLFASGAVALLGGALGSELWARSDYDKSKVEPDNARQDSLFEGAKTKRYVAQGLAVAGIGAAGVAVWLYLRSNRDEADPVALARIGKFNVEPVVSTEQSGIQLFRRF